MRFVGMYTFRPQGSDPHLKEFLFQFQTFFLWICEDHVYAIAFFAYM